MPAPGVGLKEYAQLEILICQNCGNLLRSEDVTCSNCRASISVHAVTAMPVLSNAQIPVAASAGGLSTLNQAGPNQAVSAIGPGSLSEPANPASFFPADHNSASMNRIQSPASEAAAGLQAQIAANQKTPQSTGDFFDLKPPAEAQTSNADKIKLKDESEESSIEISSAVQRKASRSGTAIKKSGNSANRLAALNSKSEAEKSSFDFQAIASNVVALSSSINKKLVVSVALVCTLLIAAGFMLGRQTNHTAVGPNNNPISSPLEFQSTPNVAGWYVVSCSNNPIERSNWNLVVKQTGRQLTVSSMDNGKSWRGTGVLLPPNQLRFEKQYYENGGPTGYPTAYSGNFSTNQLGQMEIQGFFTAQSKVFKFRQQISQIRGTWKATRKIEFFPDSITEPPHAGNWITELFSKNWIAWFFNFSGLTTAQVTQRFMVLLGVFLGFGVCFAMIALYFFGQSGKLSRLAKQEYIPSQYKALHNKMMSEWSKPMKAGSIPLGTRTEWRFWKPWVPRVMAIPPESREKNPHMILMGGSDKGKTRLLANMVCHDIESADRAVVVIDSDGELTDLVTKWTAAHAKGSAIAKRVRIIDPTYRDGSMSYNPLEPLENVNFIDAASAIVHGFKAIYTEPPGSQSQWSQQTANILRNAAILLMANNKTLLDLPTLLQDNDFRDILLEGVERKRNERTEYTTLIDSWGQYKKLARSDQWITWVEPILNRVTPMLSDPRIRPILTKPVSDLRLHDLIVEKQVLLVRIPQGQLDQNGNLLGSLIVTGLKQAALSLSNYDEDRQQPVALYLDEMNNFIEKETIEALTQETDKFQIGFVGCCKTLQHLPEDFRNQIIINVGTLLAFALAKKDGDMIGPQMFRVDGRKIKHRTITNFFNQVNSSPTFELISDEEKLNIDRVVGQEERHFFCYRVGSVAGTFNLKTHEFRDPPKNMIKKKLIEQMHNPQ